MAYPVTTGDLVSAADWNSIGQHLIESKTLASDTTTVTFSSIPGDFTHLLLIVNARGTATADFLGVQATFNSDASANYDYLRVRNDEGTVSGLSAHTANFGIVSAIPGDNAPSTAWGGGRTLIRDYASSDRTEWTLEDYSLVSSSAHRAHTGGGHFRVTGAVTQIDLVAQSGDFASGSKFELYGVV